ncbi:MAG: Signal transduction histidine kinase [Idiomarinaceae bacterium HL-53]|nr:MAG: Signal transduction histidine kinase [Idiomarinaceae bacterium HL-53]CUS47620.1 His Kinase A (phospho-acceptor) domain-containing protein [Idiomarinaceae bacterium HL-53]
MAGVSHEINTPVGIAVTAASTLDEFTRKTIGKMEKGELTRSEFSQYGERVTESTHLILSSLQRARTLISSFKQVAVDQSSEQPRRFLMSDFFEEVRHSLHPIYRQQKHKLITECKEQIEIETYPGALFQVLSNLVSNSTVHAFDKPGGKMRVQAELRGDNVVVTYSDNGKGMAPEVLAKAFDPFFTTKRGTGGSGLGLHIVYNFFTQVLHGEIKLTSQAGKGMKAVLVFPRYLNEERRGDSAVG